MTDAAKKTAKVVEEVVATSEEFLKDVKPEALSLGSKIASVAGFSFGMATTSVILVVAGAFTIAAARLSAQNVAHLFASHGKVWVDTEFHTNKS